VTGGAAGSAPGLAPPLSYCGGCGGAAVGAACQGSLERHGIRKAHWECWSECNLSCPFCFRTRGRPLDTREGSLLLRALATGSARAVVFAGGDPSLRRDLGELVEEARSLGLAVQVQTNGQHVSRSFLGSLARCEYVGLSLDGPDAATHDKFRRKPGNFRRVLSLLSQLEAQGIPVSVRTVVGLGNYRMIPDMTRIIASYSNVICWKLLEFTAIGSGFLNRAEYQISADLFEATVRAVRRRLDGSAELLEVLRNSEKVGIYMMISADGIVYGTSKAALLRTGQHQFTGMVLAEHLVHLAQRLPQAGRPRADRRAPADLSLQRSAWPDAG
jgi:MoaA/NifB/PqqE/SkfB family radical SAM enzyme